MSTDTKLHVCSYDRSLALPLSGSKAFSTRTHAHVQTKKKRFEMSVTSWQPDYTNFQKILYRWIFCDIGSSFLDVKPVLIRWAFAYTTLHASTEKCFGPGGYVVCTNLLPTAGVTFLKTPRLARPRPYGKLGLRDPRSLLILIKALSNCPFLQ
jgi:hypothetical protein